MKKYLPLFFISCFMFLTTACVTQPSVEIIVNNPIDLERTGETVEIDYTVLQAKLPLPEGHTYVVLNSSRQEIPSQILYNGTDTPQKFIFQVDVDTNHSQRYTISSVKEPTIFIQKVKGRFAPERYDDYIWENDRIAFRIYGLALIEKDGPSNGIDVIAKRTDNLFLDKIYRDYFEKKISYHQDHGEGADCYKVGRSLGAGALAPFVDNKLWLGQNFADYKTLDDGPVRTSFSLSYNAFDVNGHQVTETRIFSLDAGTQMNKITNIFTGLDGTYPVAAGIVLKNNGRVVDADKADPNHQPVLAPEQGYIIYSEEGDRAKPADENGVIYTAAVFPQPLKEAMIAQQHVLAVTNYEGGSELTYYAGAGWSKWGFETPESWTTYIETFAQKIRNPLQVTWE